MGKQYRVFQKEPYNDIPNVAVWRVLRKRLHLKAYKLSVVQGVRQISVGTKRNFVTYSIKLGTGRCGVVRSETLGTAGVEVVRLNVPQKTNGDP
jgi:hypothetical protein